MAKKTPHTFYIIVILLEITQIGINLNGSILLDNLLPGTCKNRPSGHVGINVSRKLVNKLSKCVSLSELILKIVF